MPTDPLSSTFAALADPTRRAILARLALGETSVTELAEPFAMSMTAVSKHLKVLERAGLIVRGRAAGCWGAGARRGGGRAASRRRRSSRLTNGWKTTAACGSSASIDSTIT